MNEFVYYFVYFVGMEVDIGASVFYFGFVFLFEGLSDKFGEVVLLYFKMMILLKIDVD